MNYIFYTCFALIPAMKCELNIRTALLDEYLRGYSLSFWPHHLARKQITAKAGVFLNTGKMGNHVGVLYFITCVQKYVL